MDSSPERARKKEKKEKKKKKEKKEKEQFSDPWAPGAYDPDTEPHSLSRTPSPHNLKNPDGSFRVGLVATAGKRLTPVGEGIRNFVRKSGFKPYHRPEPKG